MTSHGDGNWLTPTRGGTLLAVKVRPGAGGKRIGGVVAGRLRIAVTAPAEKGKANRELIALLAKKLEVSKGDITIEAGETSREKAVMLRGLEPNVVRVRLGIEEGD